MDFESREKLSLRGDEAGQWTNDRRVYQSNGRLRCHFPIKILTMRRQLKVRTSEDVVFDLKSFLSYFEV